MKLDVYSTEEMQLVETILKKVYRNMDYSWSSYYSSIDIYLDDYEHDLLEKILDV